jgi:hypothetical protein
MRPSSCMDSASDGSSDGSKLAYMSTASNVVCGCGEHWASLGAYPLLIYFIVTSSVLSADDAALLQSQKLQNVRFTPVYSLLMRTVQFMCCALCAGGFQW